MIIMPLDEKSVNDVLAHLWPRGLDELEKFNSTAGELRLRFLGMIGKPWTFAFYHDGPCALCFMESIGEMKWRTCFAATEEGFKKIWFPLTRFMKRISDEIVRDGGHIECLSGNPGAQRWFEAMGFRLISRNEIDKYIKFGKM
jgi:hypothetical protein